MVYSNPDIEQAKSAIVEAVNDPDVAYSPSELVEYVTQHNADISEEAISLALWDLIGGPDIELAQDWKVVAKRSAATA